VADKRIGKRLRFGPRQSMEFEAWVKHSFTQIEKWSGGALRRGDLPGEEVVTTDVLLLENGDRFLTEDGDGLLLG
jgi:hypothetical protein